MVKENKEHEFLRLVSDSQGIVHKVCRMYCRDEELRKDLFQEIMIQLWRSYGTFRGESKFSTWLYRVSLNVAIQHLRRDKKRPPESELAGDLELKDPNDQGDEERLDQLYKAVSRLNSAEKALVLLFLEGKDNEEIARIVGITQNNVRVKMSRIRTKLKQDLKL